MKKSVLSLIAIVFLLSSCQKTWEQIEDNQTNQTNEEEVVSMSDMKVSSDFNWKTSKDILINFTGIDKNDILFIKSVENDLYQKAIVKSGVNFSTKITIPTYANEIIVIYKGAQISIPITDTEILYNFV